MDFYAFLFQVRCTELHGIGAIADASGELPPAFLVSGLCAILVSTFDQSGKSIIQDIDEDCLIERDKNW